LINGIFVNWESGKNQIPITNTEGRRKPRAELLVISQFSPFGEAASFLSNREKPMVFASLLQYVFVMILMQYLFAASILTATITVELLIYINTFSMGAKS